MDTFKNEGRIPKKDLNTKLQGKHPTGSQNQDGNRFRKMSCRMKEHHRRELRHS
jgi:hypothetical protein